MRIRLLIILIILLLTGIAYAGMTFNGMTWNLQTPSGTDALLLEVGDYLLLEDGTSKILLE